MQCDMVWYAMIWYARYADDMAYPAQLCPWQFGFSAGGVGSVKNLKVGDTVLSAIPVMERTVRM